MTTIPIFEPEPFTGCLWPIYPACEADRLAWEAITDEDVKLQALALASSTLSALVAGRVGACPVTVRPCPPGCSSCRHGCLSCSSGCEINLPLVGGLYSVKVDGEEIPLENFRVDDGHIIVYQGSEKCPFLHAQDLSQRDSEPGTWSITYLPTHPVDIVAAKAVLELALEFAKACTDPKKCKLPRNVVATVRFGMTYEVEKGLFPGGLTGIDGPDSFIELWNPQHRREPSRVFSPDIVRPRVQG